MGIDQRLGLDYVVILYPGRSLNVQSESRDIYLHRTRIFRPLKRSNPLSRRQYRFATFRSYQIRIWLFGLDLLDDTSRISSHDMESRDIFSYHTSSTNSHTSADCDIWAHGNITTKPAILTNGDCTSQLRPFDTISKERIERVCSGKEGTARADESARSYRDQTGIEESAVEVDIYSFADSGTMNTCMRAGRC